MELNQENVIKLMRFRPSLKEVANLFNTSEDTIERRIREWEDCTYKEFKIRHSVGIKHKLMDRAMEMALSGNPTMMIFCLKNLCGWSDLPSAEDNSDRGPIPLAYIPLSDRKNQT
jgi:hypothetical protein